MITAWKELSHNGIVVIMQYCSLMYGFIVIEIYIYCILHGRIKGYNSSITTIMRQVGSYRTVVG